MEPANEMLLEEKKQKYLKLSAVHIQMFTTSYIDLTAKICSKAFFTANLKVLKSKIL